MAINQCEKEFFEKLKRESKTQKPIEEITLAEFKVSATALLPLAGKATDVPCEERRIPVRDGSKIRVRIYNHDLKQTTPVLFLFPNGGYSLDFFEATAISASRIAKHANIRTIAVDYRLAPEYPIPQSAYDGYDVVKYIAQHATQFNIDPSRIFVSGLSSGGNCAAVISNMQRQDDSFSVYHQILLNGWLDLTRSNTEYLAAEQEDGIATPGALELLNRMLEMSQSEFVNPLVSPYFEKDLSGLPKTTLLIAEHDGIRGDSEAYYQRLVDAGNEVERIILPGQSHCTMVLREVLHEGRDPAEVIAEVVKCSIAQGLHAK